MFSLEKRKSKSDFTAFYCCFKVSSGGADLVFLVISEKACGNGIKLYQGSSDWPVEKGCSLRGWLVTGIGLRKLSQHQVCQS